MKIFKDEISQFIKSGVDYIFIKPLTTNKILLITNFIEKYGTYRPENKIIRDVHHMLEWVDS